MWEFLQAYGVWIVFGLFFLFMLRMHGGGGCGMGHDQHSGHQEPKPKDAGTDAQQKAETARATGPSGHYH